MTGPVAAGNPRPTTEYFPPEMVRMLATARTAIDTHLPGHDGCAGCGRPWPCDVAVLAEHNLAAI